MTRAENKILYCKYEVEQIIDCEFTYTIKGVSRVFYISMKLNNINFEVCIPYCEELIEKVDVNKLVEMIIACAKEIYLQEFYRNM